MVPPSTPSPADRDLSSPEHAAPDPAPDPDPARSEPSSSSDPARRAGDGTAADPPGGVAGAVTRWQVPVGLEVATAVAWRVTLIAAAVAVGVYVLDLLSAVVIPVVLALIGASLLAPEARVLARLRHVPHSVATGVVVAGGVAAVTGVLYAVTLAFIDGLAELSASLSASIAEIQQWLRTGPLGLNNQQFDAITAELLRTLQESQATLASSALGVVSTAGELLAETLLALFTLIFFVYDGGAVWRFVLLGVPRSVRRRTDVAGRRAFAALVGYTRAIVAVAFIDAVTAGVGLWLIGVPLAVPLAALIFFGAFVPTVGAVVSGAIAALVALVSGGVTDMLLVVVLLLAVQNLEGYILQPLFLGKSIKLHPLAVVLPIACGLLLAGIPGALLAVPLVTVVDTGVRSLTRDDDDALDPGTVDPLDPRSARPEWLASDTRPLVGRLRDRWRTRPTTPRR